MDLFRDRRRGPRAALVLAGVLASTVVGAGTVANAADGDHLDVTDYDIRTNYRPDTGTLQGVTVVSATATDALDRVTLQLSGPAVRSVTVDGRRASFTQTDGELVIAPAATIRRGTGFRVRVEYDGTPGGGWLPTTSGGATAFEGNSSAWFPVHENAHDTASFHLAATVPDDFSVVSIGREGPVTGGSTFHWSEPRVDPAHIAVSIDHFTVERSTLADGTPVVTAYAPGLRDTTKPLADRLPEILDFLAGRFGRYPFHAAGNVFVHVNDDGPATSPQTRPVYLGAGNTQFMTLDAVVHEQATSGTASRSPPTSPRTCAWPSASPSTPPGCGTRPRTAPTSTPATGSRSTATSGRSGSTHPARPPGSASTTRARSPSTHYAANSATRPSTAC